MAQRTAYSTWTPQKPTFFHGHYLHNRSTLDIGVLGYIDIIQHKEHSPEVLSIPPGTPWNFAFQDNQGEISFLLVEYDEQRRTNEEQFFLFESAKLGIINLVEAKIPADIHKTASPEV